MERLVELFNTEPHFKVDVDSAWENIRPETKKKVFPMMRLVASIALLAVVGLYIFISLGNTNLIQLRAEHSVTEFKLSDGSIVTLKEGSSLHYSEESPRIVTLSGVGYFSVKKSENQKFQVLAGDATVEVLGTEFEVRSENHEIGVYVTSGSVSFGIDKDKVKLGPSMKAVIDLNSKTLLTDKDPDKNQISWYTKSFEFNDHSMSSVVEALTDHFDVDIELKNEKISQCRITGTFHDDEILDILNSICALLDLKVQQKDNRFILKGEGC